MLNSKKVNSFSFFLLSVSIFTYQNLLGPTFSTLLTGLWQAWVAVPSFLGIGLGLWICLSFFKDKANLEKYERFANHLIFYIFLSVFFSLAYFSKQIDEKLFQAMTKDVAYIEGLMLPVMFRYVPLLLAIAGIPFLFFGFILGVRFSKPQSAISAFKLELMGLLLGSLLCIWLLESWSWSTVVITVVVLNLFALLSYEYAKGLNWKLLVTPLILMLCFVAFQSLWIIQRDSHLVYRDFYKHAKIDILDTRWKSFAKVQLAETTFRDNYSSKSIAIGDGTGIAQFPNYDFSKVDVSTHRSTTKIVAVGSPKKVAVLFAGAGVEIVGLHRLLGHAIETWGVEINSAILNLVSDHQGAFYNDFFKNFSSHQVLSDNRKFLETTTEKFDSILYSWSGATVANFSGAILHTTQYSFTAEAIARALSHLEQDGRLIIMGGNKLNIILILKYLEDQGLVSNLKEKILIYSRDNADWKATWDNFIFIYKNGTWTDQQMQMHSDEVKGYNYELMVSPSTDLSSAQAFHRLMTAKDVNSEIDSLWKDHNVYPRLATDNYPFAYRNTPSLKFTDFSRLKNLIQGSLSSFNLQVFDGIIWVGAVFVILLILSFLKKDVRPDSDLLQFLAWAPLSTAALLFFLYKAILYFGEPTTAYLVIQTSTQLGSLLGLQAAGRFKKNIKNINFVFLSGLILLVTTVFALQIPAISSFIFHVNSLMSILFFVLLTAYISCSFAIYFMSQFLAAEIQNHRLGFYWAFETILSGVAGLAGAFFIEEEGLKNFVLTFVGISIILLLPKIKVLAISQK